MNYLLKISHSLHEQKIVNEMVSYRDTRIADEFKKKERRENDLLTKGVSKVEPWDENILSTKFIWHKDVIVNDYKFAEEFVLETLGQYVNEGIVERHPEYTACYYLPLEKL